MILHIVNSMMIIKQHNNNNIMTTTTTATTTTTTTTTSWAGLSDTESLVRLAKGRVAKGRAEEIGSAPCLFWVETLHWTRTEINPRWSSFAEPLNISTGFNDSSGEQTSARACFYWERNAMKRSGSLMICPTSLNVWSSAES
jgi:hypothetical protein